MNEVQDFIIELNHENIYLLEEIIFQVLLLYNQLGNDRAYFEKKISEIFSKKGLSNKDKTKKNNFFWEKIAIQFVEMVKYFNLVYDLEIKKIERKNISIQIKQNQIFLFLKQVKANIKINSNAYLISAKQIKVILSFTEEGQLILNDFDISDLYINYFWVKLLARSYIYFKKNYIIEMAQQNYFRYIEMFNEELEEFNINKLKIKNNTLKIECIKI
jgi:hypothetical protein